MSVEVAQPPAVADAAAAGVGADGDAPGPAAPDAAPADALGPEIPAAERAEEPADEPAEAPAEESPAEEAADAEGEGREAARGRGPRIPTALVAPPTRKAVPNPLVDHQTYSMVGKTSYFESRPAVVHIGGYKINHLHQTSVKIVNVSTRQQRMHVLPPTSKFFKWRWTRKGSLAAGLSEEMVIDFTPTEYRYYYDCVRIHSPEQNLLIPIHAYPVMNEVVFPQRIDFGSCAVSDTRRRTYSLKCSVPIDFEFELLVIEPNPAITITPTKGIVPGNGKTDITVTFAPTTFGSATAKVQVSISQFGFAPFICTICGSVSPGLVRDNLLSTLDADAMTATLASAADSTKRKKHPGGGGDLVTEAMYEARLKKQMAKSVNSRGAKTQKVPATPILRGVESQRSSEHLASSAGGGREPGSHQQSLRIPKKLNTHSAVADVLMQQPGKLKIKELKEAIATQNKQRMEQREMQAALISQMADADADMLETEGTRQLKELAFEHELRDKAELERSKELRWFVTVGDKPMDASQVHAVTMHRRMTDQRQIEQQKEADRQRKSSEFSQQRVVRRAHSKPATRPSFDADADDVWLKRQVNVDRLLQAMRTVVIRFRAGKRLQKIQSWLDAANWNAEVVAELVVMQNRARAGGGGATAGPSRTSSRARSRKTNKQHTESILEQARQAGKQQQLLAQEGRADTAAFSADQVLPITFPVYRDQLFRDSHPVAVDEVADFRDFDLLLLKPAVEAKCMGYEPLGPTVAGSYIPPERHRAMRSGAEEEAAVRVPRGVPNVAAAVSLAMPDVPHDSAAPPENYVFDPDPSERLYRRPMPVTELDPAFVLARDSLAHDATSTVIGTGSMRAIETVPTLSDVWLASRESHRSLPTGTLMDCPDDDDNLSDDDEEDLPLDLPRPSAEVLDKTFARVPEDVRAAREKQKKDELLLRESAMRFDTGAVQRSDQTHFARAVRKTYDELSAAMDNPWCRTQFR